MRKALAAIWAAPVLAQIYLRAFLFGPALRRRFLLGVVVLGSVAVFATLNLGPITANHPAPADPQALARLVVPIRTGIGPQQAVTIDFSAPMDRASVAQALVVDPQSAVQLRWNAASTQLQIGPAGHWEDGTFYAFTVATSARSAAGRPLQRAVNAVMLTDQAPSATIDVTGKSSTRALANAAFEMHFSSPVEYASVTSAFSTSPHLNGLFSSADPGGPTENVTFTPTEPLQPDTVYVATFDEPVVTPNGTQVNPAPRFVVRSTDAPTVTRFRPSAGTQQVDPTAAVSVRFSRPMDPLSTEAAFGLSGVDTTHGGTFSWADGNTVLVFQPSHPLTHGRAYVISVGADARSVDGLPLSLADGATAARSAFRVAPAPRTASVTTAVARPRASAPAPTPSSTSSKASSGGSSSANTSTAPWYSDEQWALSLLNCTRTGGWVQSNGTCVGYGSGHYSPYVAPLKLNAGISNAVTRPYAKLLATDHACSHFLQGNPGDRLKAAGYTSWQWGENIGCSSLPVRAMILNAILYFQSEKPYNGGHWANLKNAKFTTVGVGVWMSGGYGIVVYDFYG